MDGVRNYMEDLVELFMDEMMQKMGNCTCDQCRKDIFAITLNQLKPMYVVTTKGKAMVKSNLLEQQFKTDVITTLLNACEKVKGEMHHG